MSNTHNDSVCNKDSPRTWDFASSWWISPNVLELATLKSCLHPSGISSGLRFLARDMLPLCNFCVSSVSDHRFSLALPEGERYGVPHTGIFSLGDSPMKLSAVTSADVSGLLQQAAAIRGQSAVEGVAQQFTDMVYRRFEESLVLTRLFATVPMGRLPSSNRDFVTSLASSAGISEFVNEDTMVLSLLGTSGKLPEWNARRASRGHVGIPLASGEFVDSIPMMSRLLKEIGLHLDWIDDWDTQIVSKGFLSQSTGMFYVKDAGTAEDQDRRRIIAAQDFVARHGLKTVFGFGSGFHGNPTLVVLIAFTRETLEKSVLRPLIKVMEGFKRSAMESVLAGNFFL